MSGLELGGGGPERGPESRGCSQPACPRVSGPPLGRGPTAWLPDAFSYLGDLGQDDGSVLLALSQGLHGGQEFSPLLDFLHHCTGERTLSAGLGGRGAVPQPPGGSHSSKRSSSGPGSCRAGGAFLLRSSVSFPVAKRSWSLRFSFSRSPGGPRSGQGGCEGRPFTQTCTLQGAWAVRSWGFCRPRPFSPGGT